MANHDQCQGKEFHLPADILEKLEIAAVSSGCTPDEFIAKSLDAALREQTRENSVYLSVPINAIVEGFYVEQTTIGDIKTHGDFGLGTFNYLDGEMILLDGSAYQITANGEVKTVPDEEQTPFACVTYFHPDTWDDISERIPAADVFDLLNTLIPSPNMLYALRIDGIFEYVKTRAVPKTDNYLPLVEAAKNQVVFEFFHVEGSLAGFFTPAFMASMNAPGYHLHMLTADRRHGGHLMECRIGRAKIGIQHVPKLEVGLPVTLDYLTADFNRDTKKDLDKAER
ncbi:MAG: Alpha-acetolactate decarboxylase [Syntrophus sp. SKADARSKE-3]|nr:Alpha-acetolactate decarboxylase [Syntrophus sp. SKADARSKE-3]